VSPRTWYRHPLSSARDWLIRQLQFPELRGLDLDSPEVTIRRRDLVRRNASARYSFERWYSEIAAVVQNAPEGPRVELGSGGGFVEEFIPHLLKTDIVRLPFIDAVCSAERLCFRDSSIGAIILVNVLHHLLNVRCFFAEATRVLVPNGLIVMIEPYVSSFSRFVYGYLHHEPFEPSALSWELPPSGRLSGGNDALPWIVFARDRSHFERSFPALRIQMLRPHSALSHLLSGGVTTRPLAAPSVIRRLVSMEDRHPAAMARLGLFWTIVIQRE
jgi:SAM-dependent methyltransferase